MRAQRDRLQSFFLTALKLRRFANPFHIARVLLERFRLGRGVEAFLARSNGVIHVGASTGQERETYADYGLYVLWIEPISSVFECLQANLVSFPQQRAICALLSKRDGERSTLHVANNGGESSSVLELAEHKEIWPDIHYVEHIEMEGITLPTLLSEEVLEERAYDALVLDTQGSELEILRGAESILRQFRFIKTEVADFEAYVGCARLSELKKFLRLNGFREISRQVQAEHPNGGRYYDVLFQRTVANAWRRLGTPYLRFVRASASRLYR